MINQSEILLIINLVILITIIFIGKIDRYPFARLLLLSFILLESFSNLFIFQQKVYWLVSLIFVVTSGIFLFRLKEKIKIKGQESESNFLHKLLINNHLIHYSFYIGFFIGLSGFLAEYLFFDGEGFFTDKGFSSPLLSITFLSISWITYSYVSQSFAYERDFIFIFSHSLFIMYTLPHVALKIITQSAGEPNVHLFQENIVYNLLAKPLVSLLHLFGQKAWASGTVVSYVDTTTGLSASVAISSGCSGLYSILIFLCAYFAFSLLIKNIKFHEFLCFLIFGIILAYISNLFRMFVVVMAGHYWGYEALEFTHANLGWLVFTFWIFIFWSIASKFFFRNVVPQGNDI